MIIHVVQPGENINTIAELYNIPADRLIRENGIINPNDLVVGQAIVVVQPETVYTIMAGDTLDSIAEAHDITVMELLRNNPFLSDREFIYPGETLVISYQTNKLGTVATSGYILPHIDQNVLRKTLPFLTYLSIYNYRITAEADVIASGDDTDLVRLAREYGVAPMLFATTFAEQGISGSEIAFRIINDPELIDRLIDNLLQYLKSQNYYGINVYVEYVNLENLDIVTSYVKKSADAFHANGYRFLVTVTPEIHMNDQSLTIEEIDYSRIAEPADAIVFASYEWGRTYSYPRSITPVNVTTELLRYVTNLIPPEKIFIGLIPLGYDWSLPSIITSSANAITMNNAIRLAADNGAEIQFDESAQASYFYYLEAGTILHIIWFKDARSFAAIAELVPEFGLQGLSIWTVMEFNEQLFLVLNTNYDIQKVPVS